MLTLTAVSPFTVSGTRLKGAYVIAQHGYHPQMGDAFHYTDQKYDFYFYAQVDGDQPRDTLSIQYISRQLFAGAAPFIDPDDQDYIEQNIKHYFESVSVMSLDKILPPNPVPAIMFRWVFRR